QRLPPLLRGGVRRRDTRHLLPSAQTGRAVPHRLRVPASGSAAAGASGGGRHLRAVGSLAATSTSQATAITSRSSSISISVRVCGVYPNRAPGLCTSPSGSPPAPTGLCGGSARAGSGRAGGPGDLDDEAEVVARHRAGEGLVEGQLGPLDAPGVAGSAEGVAHAAVVDPLS